MIRTIKSMYGRTTIDSVKQLVFEDEKKYISWLKDNSSYIIHEVDNLESGLILVKYTD